MDKSGAEGNSGSLPQHEGNTLDSTRFRPLRPQLVSKQVQTTVAESLVPVKRRRIGGPRSRSGCLTCKTRRLKCDEALPACARCIKAKLQCGGYLPAVFETKPSPGSLREVPKLQALAPQPVLSHETKAITSHSTKKLRLRNILLPRPMSGLPVIEASDVIYFDIFRHRFAKELAVGYDTELWLTAISEGLQDGCVRDSILAIGALVHTIYSVGEAQRNALTDTEPPSAITPWSHERIVNEHHRSAMRHYIQAVSGFRQLIGKESASVQPRKVFIMTLLLIVYEMAQGRVETADNILNCGMAVLRNSITLFYGDQDARSDMEGVEHALPRLAVMGLFTHRLTSMWDHLPSLRVEPDFKFPSIGFDPVSKLFALWGRFYTLAVTSLCQIAHESIFPAFQANARQANFLNGLLEWKPILHQYLSLAALDPDSQCALSLILLHWDVLWISVSCSIDPTGVAFDAFTDSFRHLLVRCVRHLDEELASKAPRLMTFGEGIFMPLLCIVTCCRDHDLRMAAAAVAYSLPWQEGTWDNRVVLLGQLGAVVMEEKSRDSDGFIPPSARWWWRGGQVDTDTRTMTSRYVRNETDENGDPVDKIINVDLCQMPEICSSIGCQKDHSRILKTRLFE